MEVHRCRFVEYVPRAIHCVAFNESGSKLAVSRADADIEIWDLDSDWHLSKRILGGPGQSIEALAWIGEGRLVSAGLNGRIVEWDLQALCEKSATDSYGGPAWSLAVCAERNLLAVGCEDGMIRLFGVSNGDLSYERALPDKLEGRILSVAWWPDGSAIVAGASDGTIRKLSLASNRTVFRATLEDGRAGSRAARRAGAAAASSGEGEDDVAGRALVWSVAVLPDGTIVSGDSLGHVRFWDGAHGVLRQTLRAHEADVLSIAVSRDGQAVFASGVDSVVVQFRPVPGGAKWVEAGKSRAHTHDVRALAVAPPRWDAVVSAGVDTNIVVYPVASFGKAAHRRIAPFPHRPLVSLAPDARRVLAHDGRRINVWQLGAAVPVAEGMPVVDRARLAISQNPSQLLEIRPKGNLNIACSAISRDGSMVAFSDRKALRLLHLDASKSAAAPRVKKIRVDTSFGPSALLAFTPDGRRLVSGSFNGHVQVLDIETGTVVADFDHHTVTPDEGDDEWEWAPLCSLAISDDGQWAVSGDVHNGVHVFNLDALKHHATLPRFDSQHTAIAFQPTARSSTPVVALALADHRIVLYDVERRCLAKWSRENGKDALPLQWLRRQEKVAGIVFDPADAHRMFLFDSAMMCLVDTRKPLPRRNAFLTEQPPGGRRHFRAPRADGRKHAQNGAKAAADGDEVNGSASSGSDEDGADGERPLVDAHGHFNFEMLTRFQPLMFAGFAGRGTLVTVERPWLAVMESLPPTLYRVRYGT